MKASQIYNTTQASNSQQVLLYSNRSAVIIALVRESSTKAPSRERERERERENNDEPQQHTCKENDEPQKKRDRRQFCKSALVLPGSETKFSTFFSRSSQRSFWKLPTFFSRSSQRSFSKLPTFFLEVSNVLSRHCQGSTFIFSSLSNFFSQLMVGSSSIV